MKIFAAKNNVTQSPIFVQQGTAGFFEASPADMDTWTRLYNYQPAKVTVSATSASMFGWDAPCARAALEFEQLPVAIIG